MRTPAAKILAASALAFSMTVSGAMAADSGAALSAGKPAGVHHAQMMDNNSWLILGAVGIAAAGIALAVSGSNNNGTTPPVSTSVTTTTTTTG